MSVTPTTLDNFIKTAVSFRKEASLVISRDKKQLANFIKSFDGKGFNKAQSLQDIISNLEKGNHVYIVLDKKIPKAVYDFIAQYASGQVLLFDENNNKNVFNPTYNSSLIFLTTKSDLNKLSDYSFGLLSNLGLSYQD